MSIVDRKLRVFLSYAREDKESVQEIYQRLNGESWIAPWQDTCKILAGETWALEIRKAIDKADVIIIFLSENSVMKEGFIHAEMNYAWKRSLEKPPGTIFRIPIRLEDCEVPVGFYDLDERQWLDYFEEKNESYEKLLKSLKVRFEQRKELEDREHALNKKRNGIKARKIAEENARKEKKRKFFIEKNIDELIAQVRTAIRSQDWVFAQAKLKEILSLDVKHAEAQSNLKIVEEKIALIAVEKAKLERITREKQLAEEQARKERERQIAIGKLFHRVNGAMKVHNWSLARSKLKEILSLDAKHAEAHVKLRIVDEKLTTIAIEKVKREVVEKDEQEHVARKKKNEIKRNPKRLLSIIMLVVFFLIPVLFFLAASIITTINSPTIVSTPIIVSTATATALPTDSSPIDSMILLYVPAGEFQMGSEDGGNDEKPTHTVYLYAFWVDQTKITNAMYAKCVIAGDCDEPNSNKSSSHDYYYGNPEFDNFPVIYVSWEDASNYCAWVNRRLPTEAEWEKAAGMYDLVGDIWEWTSSLYDNYPYDAFDGREDLTVSESRVLRGGPWSDSLTRRFGVNPAYAFYDNGFRCAMDAD